MDIGKAFSFPFQTTRWVEKLLIPALIILIPILGQIYLAGWYLDITRRVIHGAPDLLPDLADIGQQFLDGLKTVLIGLVYAIPVLVLLAPIFIISQISTNGPSQASNSILLLFLLCFSGFILLYGVALGFYLPAALGNFIAHNDMSAAFRFQEIFGLLRAAPGAYVVVLIATLLAAVVAPLGSVLCGIGVAATTLYAMAVNGYLYGAAYNQARGIAQSV